MKPVSILVPLVLTVSVAYYVYIPLPDTVSEPWKLMWLDAGFRATQQVADLLQWLGLSRWVVTLQTVSGGLEVLVDLLLGSGSAGVTPGGMRVTDSTFNGVPVRVYEPPPGGEGQLRRAVMFLHGGGWALGRARLGSYDMMTRLMSDELNAVVVSVEYRTYPEVFPAPYLDGLAAAKHFLSPEVLARYSIDPHRVAVSGDSAGGNLAAAIAQQIAVDDSLRVKFSVQALVYPVLQPLDFHTPSYQQNQAVPILYRPLMVRFWMSYLDADPSLFGSFLSNNHSAQQQPTFPPELRARLNWTRLLPQSISHLYQPVVVETTSQGLVKELPVLVDVRAAPLLAELGVLAKCPRAYISTCEHDVLRDDGLMYAQRLRDAGITVTTHHHDDAFHGCMSFSFWPSKFGVGFKVLKSLIGWLQANL